MTPSTASRNPFSLTLPSLNNTSHYIRKYTIPVFGNAIPSSSKECRASGTRKQIPELSGSEADKKNLNQTPGTSIREGSRGRPRAAFGGTHGHERWKDYGRKGPAAAGQAKDNFGGASMRGEGGRGGKSSSTSRGGAAGDAERPRPHPGTAAARGRSPRAERLRSGNRSGSGAGTGAGPEQEPARRYSRAQDEPPQPERGAEAAPQPLRLHGGDGAKSRRAAPSARHGPAAGGARHGPAPLCPARVGTAMVWGSPGLPRGRDCPCDGAPRVLRAAPGRP